MFNFLKREKTFTLTVNVDELSHLIAALTVARQIIAHTGRPTEAQQKLILKLRHLK